jgi:hypothetical protein
MIQVKGFFAALVMHSGRNLTESVKEEKWDPDF